MVAAAIVWALCVALLILTVVNQFPRIRWMARLKNYDLAALIPYWTFFAPTPGTIDTRLFWRELRIDGSTSGWREVFPPVAGGWVPAVWHPAKRQRKLIIDTGQMVARMAVEDAADPFSLISLPYLLLLHRIVVERRSPMSAARQFMIVSTTEDGFLQPLLLSRWHRLDNQTPSPKTPVRTEAAS